MNPTPPIDGAARLDHWGVIRARGADAASFLHGQLTSDTAQLGPNQARLAGYCSAKGRLLASFVVWKAGDDELLLACSADLLSPTLKRLQMFVLRAKCVLSDATAEWPLYGLAGPSALAWLGEAAPPELWGRCERSGFTAIRLPDAAGGPRYLAAGTPAPALPALAAKSWQALEVRSGVVRIEAATVERFVPQMLNYELLGGVDFRKGCYPGQEVVARSQYRGSLKRRTFLFETAERVFAGQEVFHSDDPSQPAGMVANAAFDSDTPGLAGVALVEVKLAALEAGSLRVGTPDGPTLTRVELPYDVPLGAVAAD